jgi:phosphonate ABC transporter permease subunit PhnE
LADTEVRPIENGEPTEPGQRPRRSGRRSLFLALIIILGTMIYAFGYEVTDVDLDEIRSETRRTQLVRVIRELARPDLITYERIPTNTDAAILLPCPDGGFTPPAPDSNSRHIVVSPACGEPGVTITVSGFNFSGNARGTLYQVPPGSNLELRLDTFQTDEDGTFTVTLQSRERAETEPQTIRAVTRENIGTIFNRVQVETGEVDDTGAPITVTSPRISKSAADTWERIIETVFLALLATTLGVFIAVPMSFLAARNLMRDVSTPVIKLALQMLALPIGIGVGILAARVARDVSERLIENDFLVIGGVILLPILMWIALRWAYPPLEETPPTSQEKAARGAVTAGVAVAGILLMYLVSNLLISFGDWLEENGGFFDFIGSFLSSNGDILEAIIAVTTALITAGTLMSLAGRLGTWLRARVPAGVIRNATLPLAALAGAIIAVLIARGIGWLYQITDPMKITWVPAAVGALFGLFLAARAYQKEQVGIGLTIYYISRTVFNAIRSIEPLIMVIVFVVWVGLGPFAGSLALALHTVAALAKLYSEQVESIMEGPLEAVKATGANRLQTIVYAVVPQIVPPYISFTLYRWDINVRMSTIIGFAGGGGIGFLLQQNIRLLNYRAASVNMLAIAIVVASMDYLSSRVRERIV